MNTERLKELTERAEKAVRLANEIKQLQNAAPHNFYITMRARNTTHDDELPEALLVACYTSGRLAWAVKWF